MPEVKITLTTEEKAAIDKMLGSVTLEAHLKTIAANHISSDLDDEFKKLPVVEKKKKLGK